MATENKLWTPFLRLFSLASLVHARSVEDMICHTWDHLYEQYETATLKRVQKKKGNGFNTDHMELDRLNHKIAEALHRLRDHELQHGCR